MAIANMGIEQIWKEMGEERRKQATQSFYADEALKEFQRAADMFIARNKNFRPAFVKRLPVEKRAFYLAILPIPGDLVGQLIVSYHFTYKKGMMSAFLNALGIANDDGVIGEAAELKAPEKTLLADVVKEMKGRFVQEDLYIYLATLHAQNPETWAGLAEELEQLAAK